MIRWERNRRLVSGRGLDWLAIKSFLINRSYRPKAYSTNEFA
jgi:hypothetical protein